MSNDSGIVDCVIRWLAAIEELSLYWIYFLVYDISVFVSSVFIVP